MTFKSIFENQLEQIFSRKKYWIHIGIWAISLLIVLYFLYTITYDNQYTKNLPNIVDLINENIIIKGLLIGILIASFVVYSILLFFIPYARYKQKTRYFIGSFAIFGLVGFVAFVIYVYNMAKRFKALNDNLETELYKVEAANEIFLVFLIFVFPLIIINIFFQIYYFINLYEQQYYIKKYQHTVELKTVAELNFLKSQINPHFLFNSLNNIYALSLKDPNQANTTARKLKNLFKYVVNDSKQEVVAVDHEIQFLKDYIDLESVRNQKDKLEIKFQVFGDTNNLTIAPLILVNFIENAFKHGVKAQIENVFIHTSIELVDNSLSFYLVNSIAKLPETQNASIEKIGGIGLRNIRRRLAILYPNKHSLTVQKSDKEFKVHLKMIL